MQVGAPLLRSAFAESSLTDNSFSISDAELCEASTSLQRGNHHDLVHELLE